MSIKAFRQLFCVVLPFLCVFWAAEASALSVTITAQDLIGLLNDYRNSGNAKKQAFATDLQKKFADAGVTFNDNGVSIAGTIGPTGSSTFLGCDQLRNVVLGSWILSSGQFIAPNTAPVSGQVDGGTFSAFLAGNNTALSLSVNRSNVFLGVNLAGTFAANASGSLRWETGFWTPDVKWKCDFIFCGWVPDPKWRCFFVGDEGFNVAADGNFTAQVALNIDVSLEQNANGRYQLAVGRRVLASATGPLAGSVDPHVNINIRTNFMVDAPLWNLLSGQLESQLGDRARSALAQKISASNAQIRAQLPVVYELPEIDPNLLKFVIDVVDSPSLHRFIEQHFSEIVFYLLVNDRDALTQLVTSEAACEATKLVWASMPLPALYTNTSGSCVAANPDGPDQGRYFSDASCSRELAFRPTPYADFCRESLTPAPNTMIGNAASWTADAGQPNDPLPSVPSQKWTLAQGARIGVMAEPLTGKTIPVMKRVRYREIGGCALEMRVYKKDPAATGLTPLLAFHGGSWQLRGGGFVGLEAGIAHYTEQGFVVFAPFYRLAGNSDGNPECNQAPWQAIAADAEAALDWVKANGAAFGANSGKPAVMGQSAGAHLSGWLVTHRPLEVSAGFLLYAPSDIRDFLTQARVGGLYEPYLGRLNILSALYGADVGTIDLGNPPDFVIQNSFHDRVRALGGSLPPVFLMHGLVDTYVPSNQSVLMCNAYGGSAVNDGGGAARRAVYTCGVGGGQLHLFQQADHVLDVCLRIASQTLCPSGDDASRLLVADSMRQARTWLQRTSTVSISASSQAVGLGQPIDLVATVSGQNPAGTVSFFDNGTLIGTATLVNGSVRFTTAALPFGFHKFTATYSGDGTNFWSSTGTSITLTSGPVIPTLMFILNSILDD